MRIAIVGAGAIGTLLAHGLLRGGHAVTLIDLPGRVDALRAAGPLRVVDARGVETEAPPGLVTADFAAAGAQDAVLVATKAHDLPALAPRLASLGGPEAPIVTLQNGIPWWYLYGLRSPGADRIACLDPQGALAAHVPRERLIGCVAYPAASLLPDGRTLHVEGRAFPLGELDGRASDRVMQLAAALQDGGFKSRVLDDIRSEIWLKALGSMSINPISALTRADMASICTYAPTRELVARLMGEAERVALALGAHLRVGIDKRIEGARAVGAHKTSMLQDVEQGRPLELDALMLAVIELAQLTGIEAPTLRAIHACVALLNEGLLDAKKREVDL